MPDFSNKKHLALSTLFLTGLTAVGIYYLIPRDEPTLPTDLPPTAFGSSTIDIMVLYNNAANDLYDADAETRINHMVDVSNQIYQDSGVGITLRLVHSEKVDYEAGYDSTTALEHITKHTHPAFENTETLREEKGADLVVLMRPYSDDGYCGLAWIGGNGTNGDFSNPRQRDYGYSHVSIDCSSYVLAHELGHNMGLNHSRKQDGKGGTFEYALGHGVDNDFVTVMAYSSAFNAGKFKVFSNPTLSCGDTACGVNHTESNGADASYALNQVAPQIAAYYAAAANGTDTTTAWNKDPFDADGNGTSDVLLHHINGGWNIGTLQGDQVLDILTLPIGDDPNDVVVAHHDFDGDGLADVMVRNMSTGEWKMVLLHGDRVKKEDKLIMTTNLDWRVKAVNDFDGDGMADILLRNLDGRWYMYFFNGNGVKATGRPDFPKDLGQEVVSSGDFNGDGRADALLRGEDGSWTLYHMKGAETAASSNIAMKKSTDWNVLGYGDFDGDEVDDLLMRYKNGRWLVYHFNEFEATTSGFLDLTEDLSWEYASIGDYDGDGNSDVLVRNESYGTWMLYTINQAQIKSAGEVALTSDLNWAVPQG